MKKLHLFSIVFIASIFILFPGCFSKLSNSTTSNTKPDKSLAFLFNKFEQKDTLKFVECTLLNNTDSVFWILAFDTTQIGERTVIRPIFSVEEKKNGKWKLSDLGFSGIGIEAFRFPPGKEFEFETPDFDTTAEAIRIGIDLRTNPENFRASRPLRTSEIRLR